MTTSPLIPYSEAVRRLYSLERWGIKLGLDNIRAFCEHLGHPELAVPAIHIAGTNGKGSVTAFIESMLRASGYNVGRHTSPHLRDLRERIHLNGAPISRQRVCQFVGAHWPLIHSKHYSYFEVLSAMAFDAFVSTRCHLAVVEVGLGGRFDATNVLHPELTVITNIDFDHEQTLGKTLSKIAFEKAGIIKPGTPVLLGTLPEVAVHRITQVADRIGAPVFTCDDVFEAYRASGLRSLGGRTWRLPLLGAHQRHNFRVALAAVLMLNVAGVPLTIDKLAEGARHTNWPARFQVDAGRPLVVYDVAHNPSGMREFVRTWQEYGCTSGVMVFTARSDKRYQAMWQDLAPITTHWIGCPLPHSPGIERNEMEQLARATGTPFTWAETPRRAVAIARRVCPPEKMIGIVGSHYLIGEIMPGRLLSPEYHPPIVQELQENDIILSTADKGLAYSHKAFEVR